jgi:hypothetical protein
MIFSLLDLLLTRRINDIQHSDTANKLNVAFYYCYAECHKGEFGNVVCHHAESHYAECHNAECHYAECRYAECHSGEFNYVECHYAECHNAE